MAPIPWNEVNAAHLLRRAGFGGTSAEISQAVNDGLDLAVSKLVNYETISTAALDQRLTAMNLDLTTFGGINRWWLTRMVYSPRPLEERMTLFWHDHFATAISKVGDGMMMLAQNDLFRRRALGNFIDLTIEVSRDPAMLIWLDNYTNRKEHPNENYGRELLELFTLGQGFYSELDVFSASKAFTGWTLRRDGQTRIFVFRDDWHDHSQKDFLGRVGDWNGDDVVRIACREFAHGRLLASKLFAFFAYEEPEQAVVDRFAQIYLDSNNSVKRLVEEILMSEEMFSPRALWGKVKSPTDHTVIAARQLRIENDNVTRVATNPMALQGQTLFNPPDVAGWDTGMAWISAGSLLTRMNFALTMSTLFDPLQFQQGETITTPEQLVDVYARKLGPLDLSTATRDELIRYVAPNGTLPTGNGLTAKQRGLAHMILSLPEWQMY
jgi:uncharacterized protein (DUF1800 family)